MTTQPDPWHPSWAFTLADELPSADLVAAPHTSQISVPQLAS
jgi:hypothetical protein